MFDEGARPMRVITMMTQKGGSGKSTIARGLVGAAEARGLSVALLDTDTTENTLDWATKAAQGGLWNHDIAVFQTLNAREVHPIVREIEEDEEAVDLLIIDTPGDARDIHEACLGLSDLILCPINLSEQAINTALKTVNFIERARASVEDPSQVGILRVVLNLLDSRAPASVLRQERRVREDLMVTGAADRPTARLPLMRTEIRRRAAYVEMEEKGLLGRMLEPGGRRDVATRRPGLRHDGHLIAAQEEMNRLLDECLELTSAAMVEEVQ